LLFAQLQDYTELEKATYLTICC